MKHTATFLCTLLCAIALASCGSSLQLPEGILSPCDVEDQPIGSIVEVGGEINFIDDSLPGELYADLEADGCRVGLTVQTETLDAWGANAQEALQMGAQVIIEGGLDELPLPDHPDEFQYVVALQAPPRLLNEAALAGRANEEPVLPPLQGPACDLSAYVTQEMLSVAGQLIAVDASADAGISGELARDGCYVRLWIERRFWDEWTAEEQARFSGGQAIRVEGLLTYVLGEAVIDVSDPVLTD